MAHMHMCDVLYTIRIIRDSILANIIGRPFALGRTIRLPKWWDGSQVEKQEAIIVHEIVHLQQQKFSPLYTYAWWLPKYLVSRKFRGIMELEAFWAHMEHFRDCRNITILYHVIESTMTNLYLGAISIRLAKALTRAFREHRKPDDWEKFYNQNY